MGRSTKVEKNFRVDAVYKLLAEGNSRGQIIQLAAEKWDISERQVDTYIADAREKLLADCELERPAWVAEALQRLRVLEQKASKKNQTQCAINSIALQAKLIGIET
jgi:uncharacterized protein YoaH (UPF0181 family)